MNTKLLRGYFLLAAVIFILAAAAILLLTNLDDDWRLKVYWRDRFLPRAGWLLLAGVGGIVIWWTLRKMLPAGLRALREGTAIRRSKQTERRVKGLEKDRPKDRPGES